ncbi:MAG: transposase [Pyrinomonadaceae bacterium]|nr:transposase [Phycisphaerales bacterium]
MSPPAYFLTWTTYGTWLHGDQRGSADRDHNHRGTPWLSPNTRRVERVMLNLRDTPFILSYPMRAIVEQAIRDHAVHRNWRVLALNVRTNHVHTVVDRCGSYSPEAVMQRFKSWGTRRLIAARMTTSTTRVWTDHGSTRYLNDEYSAARAIDYVLNQQ